MVQLIVGNKGKGKTKILLDKVNTEVKNILGNIVYLDKSTQHMYELNNKVRLINVKDYSIENSDQFTGFVAGIISQDHDLQQMYFDSFLDIAHLRDQDITPTLKKLQALSETFNVDFVLSVSMDEAEEGKPIRSTQIPRKIKTRSHDGPGFLLPLRRMGEGGKSLTMFQRKTIFLHKSRTTLYDEVLNQNRYTGQGADIWQAAGTKPKRNPAAGST